MRHEMPPLAQLRSAYRQAIALDEERNHSPATRALRAAAQDRLAAVLLSDGEGGEAAVFGLRWGYPPPAPNSGTGRLYRAYQMIRGLRA